jgi:hypothetical protein
LPCGRDVRGVTLRGLSGRHRYSPL